MTVTPISTHKIIAKQETISDILDRYVTTVKEKSIIAVTSKIVSLCEGRVIKGEGITKPQIAMQEADYYLPPEASKYNYMITIKNNTLIASSGVDKSNGDGFYILWPQNIQASANMMRGHLIKTRKLKQVGILIVDSTSRPLRRGTTGTALAHSGFLALNDYRGKLDIFNYPMQVTMLNVSESLAAAAVVVMGEGDEQTPFAIIEDLPFVQFNKRDPTAQELAELTIGKDDDLFHPLLDTPDWKNC